MKWSVVHPLKATPGSNGYSQCNGHTNGPGQIKWKINPKGIKASGKRTGSNEDEGKLVGVERR